jgi:hypothetical protein
VKHRPRQRENYVVLPYLIIAENALDFIRACINAAKSAAEFDRFDWVELSYVWQEFRDYQAHTCAYWLDAVTDVIKEGL